MTMVNQSSTPQMASEQQNSSASGSAFDEKHIAIQSNQSGGIGDKPTMYGTSQRG